MTIFQVLQRFHPDYPCQIGDFSYFCIFVFPKIDPSTMKRILALIICLLLTTVGFSQDNNNFFSRLKNIFVVHDTVYIYVNQNANDSIADAQDTQVDDDDDDDDDERSESIPVPVDTLDTHDIFRKVVLFDNGTWLYY